MYMLRSGLVVLLTTLVAIASSSSVDVSAARAPAADTCPSKSGVDTFCSHDGRRILRCDATNRLQLIETCRGTDCEEAGTAPFCSLGGGKQVQGVGATSCDQVKSYGEGAFVCGGKYSKLYQCFTDKKTGRYSPFNRQLCGVGCCMATGGRGSCPWRC